MEYDAEEMAEGDAQSQPGGEGESLPFVNSPKLGEPEKPSNTYLEDKLMSDYQRVVK